MKETTRGEAWAILNDAFLSIQRTLQNSMLALTMKAGHHHNDAFWFRAYAEYSQYGCVIVISFDIKTNVNQFYISGDIARDDGLVLKEVIGDVMKNTIDADSEILEITRRFVSDCKKETQLIENALRCR